MDDKLAFYSSTESIDTTVRSTNKPDFDIRDYMNYDIIRRVLLSYPTELSLFEVSCILINNRVKQDTSNE